MDGVGSAGLYLYLTRDEPVRIVFTEPYLLHEALNNLGDLTGVQKLVLMDLGLNKNVFNDILNSIKHFIDSKIVVQWFDHHIWDDEWIAKLKGLGVELYIDRSTCAVGVVAKYVKPSRQDIDEGFIKELVQGVCAGDLFKFDHWRGAWYMRLIRRNDTDEWRLKVLETISKGILWIDEFNEKITERFENELSTYSRVDNNILLIEHNGLKIGLTMGDDDVENSFLAAYIIGRYDADVAVIASKDGKLSLRSRRYNVRDLAYKLGGGGHPQASGCKIDIPWKIRLKGVLEGKAVLEYITKVIVDALNDIGGLKQL